VIGVKPCGGFRESMQGVGDAHVSGFIQSANVDLGLFGPGDPLQARS
jgi:hypothetical protein